MKPKRLREEGALFWFLLPSALGVLVFFLLPFIISSGYAMADNPRTMNFVGLQNFIDILKNGVFRTALGNTLLFMALCVPLNMLVSFLLAAGLKKLTKGKNLFAFMAGLINREYKGAMSIADIRKWLAERSLKADAGWEAAYLADKAMRADEREAVIIACVARPPEEYLPELMQYIIGDEYSCAMISEKGEPTFRHSISR